MGCCGSSDAESAAERVDAALTVIGALWAREARRYPTAAQWCAARQRALAQCVTTVPPEDGATALVPAPVPFPDHVPGPVAYPFAADNDDEPLPDRRMPLPPSVLHLIAVYLSGAAPSKRPPADSTAAAAGPSTAADDVSRSELLVGRPSLIARTAAATRVVMPPTAATEWPDTSCVPLPLRMAWLVLTLADARQCPLFLERSTSGETASGGTATHRKPRQETTRFTCHWTLANVTTQRVASSKPLPPPPPSTSDGAVGVAHTVACHNPLSPGDVGRAEHWRRTVAAVACVSPAPAPVRRKNPGGGGETTRVVSAADSPWSSWGAATMRPVPALGVPPTLVAPAAPPSPTRATKANDDKDEPAEVAGDGCGEADDWMARYWVPATAGDPIVRECWSGSPVSAAPTATAAAASSSVANSDVPLALIVPSPASTDPTAAPVLGGRVAAAGAVAFQTPLERVTEHVRALTARSPLAAHAIVQCRTDCDVVYDKTAEYEVTFWLQSPTLSYRVTPPPLDPVRADADADPLLVLRLVLTVRSAGRDRAKTHLGITDLDPIKEEARPAVHRPVQARVRKPPPPVCPLPPPTPVVRSLPVRQSISKRCRRLRAARRLKGSARARARAAEPHSAPAASAARGSRSRTPPIRSRELATPPSDAQTPPILTHSATLFGSVAPVTPPIESDAKAVPATGTSVSALSAPISFAVGAAAPVASSARPLELPAQLTRETYRELLRNAAASFGIHAPDEPSVHRRFVLFAYITRADPPTATASAAAAAPSAPAVCALRPGDLHAARYGELLTAAREQRLQLSLAVWQLPPRPAPLDIAAAAAGAAAIESGQWASTPPPHASADAPAVGTLSNRLLADSAAKAIGAKRVELFRSRINRRDGSRCVISGDDEPVTDQDMLSGGLNASHLISVADRGRSLVMGSYLTAGMVKLLPQKLPAVELTAAEAEAAHALLDAYDRGEFAPYDRPPDTPLPGSSSTSSAALSPQPTTPTDHKTARSTAGSGATLASTATAAAGAAASAAAHIPIAAGALEPRPTAEVLTAAHADDRFTHRLTGAQLLTNAQPKPEELPELVLLTRRTFNGALETGSIWFDASLRVRATAGWRARHPDAWRGCDAAGAAPGAGGRLVRAPFRLELEDFDTSARGGSLHCISTDSGSSLNAQARFPPAAVFAAQRWLAASLRHTRALEARRLFEAAAASGIKPATSPTVPLDKIAAEVNWPLIRQFPQILTDPKSTITRPHLFAFLAFARQSASPKTAKTERLADRVVTVLKSLSDKEFDAVMQRIVASLQT